jgi:hypothetical protein
VNNPLETFARRVEADPFFLASLLADYTRSEGLDDAGLVAALGCRPEDLTALRLCGAPDVEPSGFWKDVTAIATHFHLDRDRLAHVVRRGQALQRLRRAAGGTHGTLLAARDDEPAGEGPP